MRLKDSGAVIFIAGLAGVILLASLPGRAQAPGVRPASDPGQPPTIAGRGAAPATRTGVIRGRVLTVGGAPLRRAQVSLKTGNAPGPGDVVAATDDQGRYEITGLPAGRHTLTAAKAGYLTLSYGQRRSFESARPVELADGQILDRIDVRLPRGGVIDVYVTDDLGDPIAGAYVQAEYYAFSDGTRRLQSAAVAVSDDRGEARLSGLTPGEYYVSADMASFTSSGVLAVSDSGRRYAYTYAPGTLDVREARRVAIDIGEEKTVTLSLVIARAARVSGFVQKSDGSAPTGHGLTLSREITSAGTTRFSAIQPDGTFSIPNLVPGEYVLGVSPTGSSGEYARVVVTVSGADIPDLVIATSKGTIAHGQIVFDTGAPPTGLSPTSIRMTATYVDRQAASYQGRSTTNDDWTFDMTELAGTGLLRLRAPANGWFQKAVMLNDKDVTDVPMDFSGGKVLKDLQVVLTQKRTEIAGSVADSSGAVAAEYVTVIFPEDRSQWTGLSRRIAAVRSDQQGLFKITGLPAGRYLAVALDYMPTGQERDPELLGRLQGSATRLTLGDGESRSLSLRLTTY